VATWTLKRIVILVAAVIVGLIVLRNGFPSNASQGITGPPASPGGGASPTASPSVTTSPSPTASPRIEGVVVLVLNGTDRDGIAAGVSTALENEGYTVRTPDNAPNRQRTAIFYQEGYQAEADLMKTQFLPNAVVRPAGSSVPDDVHLQVILGADFAP
jgi:hypothetical protein